MNQPGRSWLDCPKSRPVHCLHSSGLAVDVSSREAEGQGGVRSAPPPLLSFATTTKLECQAPLSVLVYTAAELPSAVLAPVVVSTHLTLSFQDATILLE